MPFDDFAGSRIDDGRTVRPAARSTMYPLNDVVAQIHRVRPFGHKFHVKGVFVTGRLKSLVPPASPFEKRGANRLRRAAVEIVNDGFYGFAKGGRRISFLEAMPRDEALHDRLAHRCGVIHVGNPEEAAARIVNTRLVAGRGKLHEGMMLADGDRFR